MFFFMAQITQNLLFSAMPVLKRLKISVSEGHLFKKNFCLESFRYVTTLPKKIFLGAPVKCVFLYGSNNTDYVVLGFAEIEGHRLITTTGMPVLKRSKITV